MMDYQKFLQQKSQWNEASGFEPVDIQAVTDTVQVERELFV